MERRASNLDLERGDRCDHAIPIEARHSASEREGWAVSCPRVTQQVAVGRLGCAVAEIGASPRDLSVRCGLAVYITFVLPILHKGQVEFQAQICRAARWHMQSNWGSRTWPLDCSRNLALANPAEYGNSIAAAAAYAKNGRAGSLSNSNLRLPAIQAAVTMIPASITMTATASTPVEYLCLNLHSFAWSLHPAPMV